jgi:two-component system alkaline phosphatase synthesis response regulator PhoP
VRVPGPFTARPALTAIQSASECYNARVRPRVMLIEDEKDIVELVRYNFRKEGFDVASFASGREGWEELRRNPPDLVLLDIMLPDLDGFEICKRLRAEDRLRSLPVIFLTAKGEELDRILGLEIGADDYVVKPFSPRELVARVKAVLRRQERPAEKREVIEAHGLRLDSRTQEVTVRGEAVELSTLEFKLLHFLASHPRRIFSRECLLDEVWGRDRFVTPRTVDVHIRRLREKIEAQADKPQYIQTVRGAGYRFTAEAEEDDHS